MMKTKHTFFCSDLSFGVLNEEESGHASRVLRLTEGDTIRVVNGKGRSVVAKITSTSKKEVGFEIIEEQHNKQHPLNVHIAIAPTKNFDRFSFFLEKVTELGCKEITPVYTTHSERKSLRTDKGKKVMISALKQSGNLFLPKLNEPLSLRDLLDNENDHDLKVIAHCETGAGKKELKDILKKGISVLILIGPEGDFTSEEVNLAEEKGFFSVSLGEARFRTETAGILACHTAYLYL